MGYFFKDKALLFEALTHRSAVVEATRRYSGQDYKEFCKEIKWNERIEFLGDSILGLTISSILYSHNADLTEGQLSKIRAGLVSESTLARVAERLGVAECLILGKGEEASGGRSRDAMLADSMEAIFGAIYLDGGTDVAKIQITRIYEPFFESGLNTFLMSDHKTRLQELTQKQFRITPEYIVVDEVGPDHLKQFTVECRLEGKVLGIGTGKSKKKSSIAAAINAFEKLSSSKG